MAKPPSPQPGRVQRGGKVLSRNNTRPSMTYVEIAERSRNVDPDAPLSDKQRRAILSLAEGNNQTSAAIHAGFSDSSALCKLMRQPNMQKALAVEKAKFAASSDISRKMVFDGLMEGIEMAKLMAEPASVITGWKTIGQMAGFFEPVKRKIDITVNGGALMERMNSMTDAELLKLAIPEVLEEVERITHEPAEEDE